MRDNVTVLLLNFVIINCEGLEKMGKKCHKKLQKRTEISRKWSTRYSPEPTVSAETFG
jgi:hypothetical protein